MNAISKKKKREELLPTILISLAAVFSAWCAFQSSIWNGIQSFALSESNTLRQEAQLMELADSQLLNLNVMVFIQYINAYYEKNEDLLNFYKRRISDELKPAFKVWLQQNPFENPNAPPHPFILKEYKGRYADQAAEKNKLAEKKFKISHQANLTSDIYILLTVFFALVLFFGAISGRTESKIARTIFLWLGLGIFLAALFLLAHYPISLETGSFLFDALGID